MNHFTKVFLTSFLLLVCTNIGFTQWTSQNFTGFPSGHFVNVISAADQNVVWASDLVPNQQFTFEIYI